MGRDPRSVVLVTIDSLRADHCGHHGYDRDTTPTLDAMARDGLAFETAVAPGPSTPESMPAVLTGAYPEPAGEAGDSLLARRRATVRRHMRARETLAERFSRAGYATGGFSPNPYTSRYFGFDEGFDRYEDFLGGSRRRLYAGALDGALAGVSLSALFPARVALNWAKREEVFKPWEAFYGDVRSWVDGADGPYFLWVLLMDAHDPYLVPSEYRTQPRRATYRANWRLWRQGHRPPFPARTHERLARAYDDAVRYADAFLARLRADLPGDPLVAVHGDHGEAFGEHGTYGHHQRLYEENVRVPLVVEGGPARTVERPVSLQHLPDVLWALARDDPLSLPDGPVRTRTLAGDRVALRGRGWKYVDRPEGATVYDLTADPGEREGRSADDGDGAGDRNDGAQDSDDRVAACRALVDRWRTDRAERRRVRDAADELAEEEA